MQIIFWTLVFLIVYSYFLYPVFLRAILFFKKAVRVTDENYTPMVTMIVSAYNEEYILEEKINNFLNINYPENKIELVIGNDGSSDGTKKILDKFHDNTRIRCYNFKERNGKSWVLNKLIPESRGEIIVFSDANTLYSESSIRKIMKHFKDGKTGGVCGRLILNNPKDMLNIHGEVKYWNYENRIKSLEGSIKSITGANGSIYAIRKDLFTKIPGSKFYNDDFIIPVNIIKKGFDIVFEPDAEAWEFTSPTLKDEFLRRIRIGAGNYNALPQILELLNPFKGFIAFSLWSHKVIRWFVPFMLLLIFIINLLLLPIQFYRVLFILQIMFYLAGLTGIAFNNRKKLNNVFMYPAYFLIINSALFAGFIKALTGKQRKTWSRVERS